MGILQQCLDAVGAVSQCMKQFLGPIGLWHFYPINQSSYRQVEYLMAKMVTQYKDWKDYPIGTKAYAIEGGFWEKKLTGWKWCTGATFPTPGGCVSKVEIP